MPQPTFADPETGVLDDLVALDRYPIDRPRGGAWEATVAGVREQLDDRGIAVLPGFVRPDGLRHLQRSLAQQRRYVRFTSERRSVYAREAGGLDADDPRVVEAEWIAGHITRDMIPPYSPAQRVYVAPGFKHFIAACLGREQVFEYADPLAGLIATVLPPGGRYGWHYDTNEFVVTIGVSAAEAGGHFEFVPNLRRPGDENLEGLAAVLGGNREPVRSVSTEPGDLQIFLGRYSLHRVAEVAGGDDRITLVLSYSERPGVIGPADRTRRVYGRVTETHLTQHSSEHDSDGLIR